MKNLKLTIRTDSNKDVLNFQADDLTEQEGLMMIDRMFATMGVPLAASQQPVTQIVTETTSASAHLDEPNDIAFPDWIPNTPENQHKITQAIMQSLDQVYGDVKPDDFKVEVEPTNIEGQLKVTVSEAEPDSTESFEEALADYDKDNPMVQAMAKAKGIVTEAPKPGSKQHAVKPPGRSNVRTKRDAQGTFNLIEHGVAITLYQTHTICPNCGHDDRVFGREKNRYIKCEGCKTMLRMERAVDRVSETGPIADEDGDYFVANKIYEYGDGVPHDKSQGRSTPKA